MAELSRKNPNVNYELGICHALGVPTVLITQNTKNIPFDYRHLRHIPYRRKDPRWKQKLASDLKITISAVLGGPDSDAYFVWPQGARLSSEKRKTKRSPSKIPTLAAVLEHPVVPFSQGQNADFLKQAISPKTKGFRLRIDIPESKYWRVGFVLSPDDYIREGRSEIRIQTFFLFHIGRGSSAHPDGPTEKLRYMTYYNDKIVRHSTQFESFGVFVAEVRFARDRAALSIGFDGVFFEGGIDPNYLRYLYVLAWADNLAPFRVPVRLDLL